MNTRVETTGALREAANVASALVQLTKPRVTRLVLVTSWLGAVLAPGSLDTFATLLTLLGTVLVVASANTLNMFLEHEVDGLMERTRDRPLPAGRLSRDVALGFGLAMGVAGLLVLLLMVNPLTALLAAVSLATYVLLYTPMKAKTSLALYVGAVPGAMPPVLGYTGLSGELTMEATALFALLFVWQVPHFLAITVFRREDYRLAGLQVMSVEYGLTSTRRAISMTSFALLLTSLAPWAAGLGGTWYLAVALISGTAFTAWATVGHRGRDIDRWARSVFFASMPYLVVLFTLLGLSAP
jgi:protoheme IX farnesyltransferase